MQSKEASGARVYGIKSMPLGNIGLTSSLFKKKILTSSNDPYIQKIMMV